MCCTQCNQNERVLSRMSIIYPSIMQHISHSHLQHDSLNCCHSINQLTDFVHQIKNNNNNNKNNNNKKKKEKKKKRKRKKNDFFISMAFK